jgi:hypothetical protein
MTPARSWTPAVLFALFLTAAACAGDPVPCPTPIAPWAARPSEPAPIAYSAPCVEPARPACCPEPKSYHIKLKMTDSKGEVLCRPEICVVEGQFARCEIPCPCEGKQGSTPGCGFKVVVTGTNDKKATLEVEAYQVVLSKAKDTAVRREQKVSWTSKFKLGEPKKLRCEHYDGKKVVRTYLEATVSEWSRTPEVACQPVTYQATPCCPPAYAPTPVIVPPTVVPAVYTVPAAPVPPPVPSGTVIAIKRAGSEHCLDVKHNGTGHTCAGTVQVMLPCGHPVTLSVEDKRVYLKTDSFEALAQRVRTGPAGELILDGEVRISCDKVGDVQAGHVVVSFKSGGRPEFHVRSAEK